MVRGFYSAASGVFSRQKSFNTISNNMSNVSTAGYKSQSTVESSFGEHLVSKLNSMNAGSCVNIGKGSFLTANIGEYTDLNQGAFEQTGRNLDMAINGEGYFLIDSSNNGEVLTRNGQFEMDQEGYLVLSGVGKVLNKEGTPILINNSNFSVDSNGVIREQDEDKIIDSLFIAVPGEGSTLKMVGEGTFQCSGGFIPGEEKSYQLVQGSIEKSNINIAQEMSRMIAGQNHFQSCIQLLKIYDKINELSANQIGRIG